MNPHIAQATIAKVKELWPRTSWGPDEQEEIERRLDAVPLDFEQARAALVNFRLEHKYPRLTSLELFVVLERALPAIAPVVGQNPSNALSLVEHLKLHWGKPNLADEDVMWHYAYQQAQPPAARPAPLPSVVHAMSFEVETRMLGWPRGQQLSVLEMYSDADGIAAVKSAWAKVDAECERRRPVPA